MTSALFFAAFAQGLAGSVHCLGMCGPFALVLAGPEGRAPWMVLLYNLGRACAYALMGLTLGFVGGAANQFFAGPLAAILGGSLIILFGLSYLFPGSRLSAKLAAPPPFLRKLQSRLLAMRSYRAPFAFLFGVSTAFLPCGMLYAALGLATASGNAWTGAAAMAIFSLGTWPALFLAGSAGPLLNRINGRWFRLGMAVIMIVMGLFIIGRRVLGGGHNHHKHGALDVRDARESRLYSNASGGRP